MKAFVDIGRALCALAAILMADSATAEPVTLAFEAEITNVFNAETFDPGISFSVGDTIRGQFTFEPAVANGEMSLEGVQPHSFLVTLDGITLVAPSYTLRSIDDSPILDFPPANIVDSLTAEHTGLQPSEVGDLPNIEFASSSFRLDLTGPADVLNEPEFPANPAVWNQLVHRHVLNIGLDGVGLGGAGIGIQAEIGEFVIVPQPSSCSLLFIGLVVVTLSKRIIFLNQQEGSRNAFL